MISNPKEGVHFLHITDYWKQIAGACVFITGTILMEVVLHPCFKTIAKGEDDEIRDKYATKAGSNLWASIWGTLLTVWGYRVLRNSVWLPSYLGGRAGGTFENMFKEAPMQYCPPEVYDYNLFASGLYLAKLILLFA